MKLVLPRHARCVVSSLRCNGHRLLLNSVSQGLAESRILLAAPADTRPRTPLMSFCAVQLPTLCAARSLATLCLSTTSRQGHGEFPGFRGSMVFRLAAIPRKGLGKQQHQELTQNSSSFLGDFVKARRFFLVLFCVSFP